MVGNNSALVPMTGSPVNTIVSGTTASNVTFINETGSSIVISGSVDSSSPSKDAENFAVVVPANSSIVWPDSFAPDYGILMSGPTSTSVSWRFHGHS